jgi:hypothetical protein
MPKGAWNNHEGGVSIFFETPPFLYFCSLLFNPHFPHAFKLSTGIFWILSCQSYRPFLRKEKAISGQYSAILPRTVQRQARRESFHRHQTRVRMIGIFKNGQKARLTSGLETTILPKRNMDISLALF